MVCGVGNGNVIGTRVGASEGAGEDDGKTDEGKSDIFSIYLYLV